MPGPLPLAISMISITIPTTKSREYLYSHSLEEKANTKKGSVTTSGIARKGQKQNSVPANL